MARKKRPQIAGGLYHVTMRGNNKGEIFFDDGDRVRFLSALAEVRHRCGWSIHAYCLMTNHYHVLLETPEPNIAEGMQWFNSRYSHQTNAIHGRVGHLFQRRYADGLVVEEPHLRSVLRYIPLNPVKAGLCSRAEDWPWSSYRATLGLTPRPRFLTVRWLLSHFSDGSTPHERCIANGCRMGWLTSRLSRPIPWARSSKPRGHLPIRSDVRERPDSRSVTSRATSA